MYIYLFCVYFVFIIFYYEAGGILVKLRLPGQFIHYNCMSIIIMFTIVYSPNLCIWH